MEYLNLLKEIKHVPMKPLILNPLSRQVFFKLTSRNILKKLALNADPICREMLKIELREKFHDRRHLYLRNKIIESHKELNSLKLLLDIHFKNFVNS